MPNTALTLDNGRQKALSAIVPFSYLNLIDTAVAVRAAHLPYGAIITGGYVVVDVAFNTATSATLAVGDLITPARYVAAVNLKATGKTDLVPTGYLSDGEAIWVTPTNVGANATAGSGRMILSYVIQNRAEEVQPN